MGYLFALILGLSLGGILNSPAPPTLATYDDHAGQRGTILAGYCASPPQKYFARAGTNIKYQEQMAEWRKMCEM